MDADLAAVGELSEVGINVGESLEPNSGDPDLPVARRFNHWRGRVINGPKQNRVVSGALQSDLVVADGHGPVDLLSAGRDNHRAGAAQTIERSLNRFLRLVCNKNHSLRRGSAGKKQTCRATEPHLRKGTAAGHSIPPLAVYSALVME